jgi:glutathione S-transferase
LSVAGNVLMLPVLYSFRRCPYAIRARMAICYAGVPVELREILLKNKPPSMLAASPKGTVPVLVLPDGRVLDESCDVMRWGQASHDPDNWMDPTVSREVSRLIAENDGSFKTHLDHYKYADRYPEQTPAHYRAEGEVFLQTLEARLQQQSFLCGHQPGFADVAIFPFVRQFSLVDPDWFASAPYPKLRHWLISWLESPLFIAVMEKYPVWQEGSVVHYFGCAADNEC